MDRKRRKLSGSQYKKRRVEKEESKKKLRGAMQDFLVRQSSTDEPSTSTTTHMDSLPTTVDRSPSEPFQSLPKESQEITLPAPEVHQDQGCSDSEVQDVVNEIPADPALWNASHMSAKVRQILVERGPQQIKEFEFPINKGRRRFSPSHYSKVLSNGEIVERSWLIYSVSNDVVFCFCCILFGNSSASEWPKTGYSDWGNLVRALTMHENSVCHRNAFRAWKELDIRLKQKKTIDAEYQRIIDLEIQHWRGVLKRILSIIKLLSSQCLAFRGKTEHLFLPNNGNFLKLVELLAEFDPVMEEHVRRIQRESDKWSVTYLSNNIQDELINLMGNKVLNKIIELIKQAKYFSIIADCTPDVSHVEQLSLTIRIVNFDSIQKSYEIEEFFIGFFEADDSTGEGLTELIITHLTNLGLDLKCLRGQGYDNGANMKGVRKGVQNRILEKYPRAFYVPCACHSLNLVVNDAASSSTETTFFFSIVQEIYTFFSGSTKRWEVLKKHVSQLTLKQLSATRWSSRIDALQSLRYQLHEIYDALVDIIEDEYRDAETKVKARGLANKLQVYLRFDSVA